MASNGTVTRNQFGEALTWFSYPVSCWALWS